MTKASTKKWLRLAVVLYIVILSVVAVTSLAWFVFEDTTSLQTSENYMKIIGGGELAIAVLPDDQSGVELGNYSTEQLLAGRAPAQTEEAEQDPDAEEGDEAFEGYVYPDISGDGKTFYYPRFVHVEDGVNIPPAEYTDGNYVTITQANGNMDSYMSVVRLGFRSASPMSVYLHNKSSVTGQAIANAVRVAFYSREDDTTFVWCPNETKAEDVKYLSLVNGNIVEKSYEAGSFLRRDVLMGSSQLASTYDESDPNESKPNAMINNAFPIVTFTEEDFATQGYAYKEVYVYIWVEGTDPDALDRNKDQTLEYALYFIGIDKEINSLELNKIVYEGGKLRYNGEQTPQFDYSTDGITWRRYVNELQLGGATTFYVRFAETASTQPGIGTTDAPRYVTFTAN